MQRELARGELDAIVRRYRMMRMSDGDWGQSICEGIDACRLESPVGPELTTSIADVTLDEASAPDAPLWCSNPKFSAFVVVKEDGGRGDEGDGAGSNVLTATVTERLRQCRSEDDARDIIKEAFAAQMGTALGLDGTVSDQELMASRSTDLGTDSLVSVDLHSWFLRNIQVNVPTLSIMGSGSLADLVQNAVDNLPRELLATAHDSEEASSAQDSGDSSPSRVAGSVTPAIPSHRQSSPLPSSDLAQPLLGISALTAQSISDSASAVIHCSADTSHVKHFIDVRASNLGSTIEIARECLRRRIPLYYVSSAGLGMLHRNSREDGFPPGHIDVPAAQVPDRTEGYICSKWASERFLERASEAYGLRVEIYRPSTIVRKGSDTVGDEADKDWVNAFIKYVRLLKAAPESRSNSGFLDLVRVDTVCEQIMGRVFDSSQSTMGINEGNDVTYFNAVGDEVLALDGLQNIGLADNEAFTKLPREEWTRRAVAAGLHPGVAVLIETMDEVGVNYPRLWKGMSGSRV
ncbi:Male sterility, NAD-binding [Penicillium griseofulvum]|uniref:Male sterility, NAD-binding n=1 Tax=Penicillium patulum TaxID=5078 RepID=A0A135LCA7_PENPA|nr:Male sterility, NAD-binding [Penicillium griseofulvum]KXG46602.1 Male sterility, NAD-binding [Penicillium griseofulvum]